MYSVTLLCSLSYTCIHTYVHRFRYEHSPGGGGKESDILNNFATINSPLQYLWLCVHLTLCRCAFVSVLCVVLWEALEIGHREKKRAYESIIYICLLWSMGVWGQCSRFIWVHVYFDIRYRPSTDFFLVWGYIGSRYRLICFWYESI